MIRADTKVRPYKKSLTLALSRGERESFRNTLYARTTNLALRKASNRVNCYPFRLRMKSCRMDSKG